MTIVNRPDLSMVLRSNVKPVDDNIDTAGHLAPINSKAEPLRKTSAWWVVRMNDRDQVILGDILPLRRAPAMSTGSTRADRGAEPRLTGSHPRQDAARWRRSVTTCGKACRS
jgi:hypothetical protein